MYQAELKGKLPRSARDLEDILTSNVFSFLKYSHRPTYLRQFLRRAEIEIQPAELNRVAINFWPQYEEGTEPDVVIETDEHYLLIEAKYISGVAEEDGNPAGQLIRERRTGFLEAQNRRKSFRLLLITSDATPPTNVISAIPAHFRASVFWISWQAIAEILLTELEKSGKAAPDYAFATDLYDLLDHKHLRGFITFNRLAGINPKPMSGHLFFAAETASFRGDFIGFRAALSTMPQVSAPPTAVFYAADARFDWQTIPRPLFDNHIFFQGVNDEQRT